MKRLRNRLAKVDWIKVGRLIVDAANAAARVLAALHGH